MANVNISTTIPNGLILQLDNAPGFYAETPAYQSVSLASAQDGTTNTVDANFWTNWKAENSANPLLVNGQIFEV